MSGRHFLDTNILLYSVSTAPAEAAKRQRAVALLERQDGALSVQVLQEFYFQATHSRRPDALTHRDAVDLIEAWNRFALQDMTLSIVMDALEIKASYGFSYWDCAIVAAARRLGCEVLYTEDLTHGSDVTGVRIVNPFRELAS
jgi:predicted nucleic acid-binding protein